MNGDVLWSASFSRLEKGTKQTGTLSVCTVSIFCMFCCCLHHQRANRKCAGSDAMMRRYLRACDWCIAPPPPTQRRPFVIQCIKTRLKDDCVFNQLSSGSLHAIQSVTCTEARPAACRDAAGLCTGCRVIRIFVVRVCTQKQHDVLDGSDKICVSRLNMSFNWKDQLSETEIHQLEFFKAGMIFTHCC